ncbi:ATP-binding protein [Steroidobacter sp. S1-65]|uniref:ATP-binding protein n=1 Tax=Steroidobacter gossypii TaxID=2805490 RepID=A0ABS1WUL2_9GAMM|nr:AAA family ATPase [Steroidobacter gossypii]MBM0104661.1 ATP-binding protein [Steroidobacter gossypii]
MNIEFDDGRGNAFAWLDGAAADREVQRLIAPFLDAAAVLSTFELATLQPVDARANENRNEALIELTNFARPVQESNVDCWQLEESARRMGLRRLKDREGMRRARAVNVVHAPDPLQQALDTLIDSNDPIALGTLSLEQLLAFERATRWLEGILPNLPSRAQITADIERQRQLEPMRKLAGENFVDREDYLARLTDYVGVLPPESTWQRFRRNVQYVRYLLHQRPPLHLFGPGGMGKSALLARFILQHAGDPSRPPMPFVYLDFDRGALDPRRPNTLLEDAIRQLLAQFPDFDGVLGSLSSEVAEVEGSHDVHESSKSSHFSGGERLINRFCRLLDAIAQRTEQPVLMILDTLEEAEYQGTTAMLVTWALLAELLGRVDRLRIVTAGRSPLANDLQREPVELTGLPTEAAIELIVKRTQKMQGGPISEADARSIVELVGTVPLNLVLAAKVVLSEDLAALREAVGRRRLFARIKQEQQQGMLYRRILAHVRKHDPELEKVASPGLILRRITPEIIEKVLAAPCELQLVDANHPTRLFDELAREVGLVDPYLEHGALWHLPALRRIMLPDLRATLGAVVEDIHKLAAEYYSKSDTTLGRAEEIYHRLWIGASFDELDKLWRPEFAPHLRGAYEELEPQSKVWLADKLGIELSSELRAHADLAIWERQAAQRARTLIANGLFAEALAAVRERPRPERPSPLYEIESDVLKLLGNFEAAHAVLDRGLEISEQAGDRPAILALMLRKGFLLEGERQLTAAIRIMSEALNIAASLRDLMSTLSAGVATLRLYRKMQQEGTLAENVGQARERLGVVAYRRIRDFQVTTHQRLVQLIKQKSVRAELRSRPALLQETAAELGLDDYTILEQAVLQLGVSAADLIALARLAREAGMDELHGRSLRKLLYDRGTSRGSGRMLSELVPVYAEFFVQRLARAVDDALERRSVDTPGSPSWRRPLAVSAHEMAQLRNLVEQEFTPEELALLAQDYAEVSLHQLSPSGTFSIQVIELLRYAEKHGSLGVLLTHMARARPDGSELKKFIHGLDGWLEYI